MIYLIDDNQHDQQKQKFKADYLFTGEYDSFLKVITTIRHDTIKDLKLELKSAKAIFLHNTYEDQDEEGNYIKNSLRIKKMIEEDIANKENIPLVLFSYGMSPITTYDYDNDPNQIESIRKDIFYENLQSFLENYKATNIVDFRYIAYGKNFHVELAIKKSEEILNTFVDNVFVFNKLDFNLLENYYKLTNSNSDFNAFLDFIEENVFTVTDFKNLIKNINRSLLRYGKNIHN